MDEHIWNVRQHRDKAESMADSTPSPRRTRIIEVVGAVVAIAAVVVSIVTLARSCGTEEKKQGESNREQASLVGFFRGVNSSGFETITVSNHSHRPIYDAVVTFPNGYFFELGGLEGCKRWESPGLVHYTPSGQRIDLKEPSRLDFDDAGDPSERWTIWDSVAVKHESEPSRDAEKGLGGGVTTNMEHCGG
ncbi:hypothetical protein ACIP4S_03935 [Streptomyces chartreusis]|uniref:hypothetical protein n=1 Tax=Streptomyces chartreusis TaxID=1969 RepID=UPI0037F28799